MNKTPIQWTDFTINPFRFGARPVHNHGNMSFGGGLSWIKLEGRKGGDPAEWPSDLRVQQFPAVSR